MKEYKRELMNSLAEGANYGNDAAGWFTLNRIKFEGEMMIQFNDKVYHYDTLLKYTNAVKKLLNTGSL